MYARGCQRTATRESCGTASLSNRPKKGCARHVPARPREAGYQFVFNGIGHAYCNDGNDAGRLFCRAGGRRALRHNDIDLAFDQLNCGLAKSIWIRFSKPPLKADILSVHITEIAQASDHSVDHHTTCIGPFSMALHQNAYPRNPGSLLSQRPELFSDRPTTENRDEIAPPH